MPVNAARFNINLQNCFKRNLILLITISQRRVAEMQSAIDAIIGDGSLYQEKNFDARIEAIDDIEFLVLHRIENFLQKTDQPDPLNLLKRRAETLKAELEAIDITLFKKLRAKITINNYRGEAFKNIISQYAEINLSDNQHQEEPDYDSLDIFVNGLVHFQMMPRQAKDLEPEMVFYQKTPARIVFELVERLHFNEDDVFFDLGSGLGQVAILVNLLTCVTTKGIEFDPAFCNYANDCATELKLSNACFINADAREVDYTDGTVFFMFTPFKGEILQDVLAILKRESLSRKIKIITYGPCTAQVAL